MKRQTGHITCTVFEFVFHISIDVSLLTDNQGLFAGVDAKEASNTALKLLNERYKNKVIPLSDYGLILIRKTGINKYLYSTNADENAHLNKLKATGEFENLLLNAEYLKSTKDTKNHSFATYGFDHYKTVFAIDWQVFEGIIDVGVSEKGAEFYGMTNIKRVAGSGNYSDPLSVYKSASYSGNSSNGGIAQNAPTVNSNIRKRNRNDTHKRKLGTDNGWRKAAGLWAEALNAARNTENSTQKKYKLSGENDAIIAYEPEESNKITKISKTFDNYVEGKDITLKEFFNMSRRKTKKFQKLYMGKISNEMAALINKVFMDNGVESDVSGGNFIISNDMFDHIEKGHGINSNETAEKITADNVDYLKNVINKPDSIEFAGFTEQGNPKIVFEKKIDNTSAVYVQFSSENRNGLFGITFYVKGKLKKGTITANNSNNAPVLYTQSDHDQIPFNNSIAQNAPAVKNNIRKSGKNVYAILIWVTNITVIQSAQT